jgi:hypothetical protein
MIRYLSAICVGVWLGAAAFWPQLSRADEEHERSLEVEKHDGGYEVKEKETRHGEKKHDDEKVQVKERSEKDDEGNEVYHREKRVEHGDDD